MMPLPQSWYLRDAAQVARELLGTHICRGRVVLRVTEVEAYLGPDDSACHTSRGRTARNAPMWGPGGHAYIYLCYGMHNMLNVVTGDGDGAAVLIRSCEVVRGLPLVLQRRGAQQGPGLLAGPGKVGQALDLSTALSGHALFTRGGLTLHWGTPATCILAGRRVGIDYAQPRDRNALLRFADADSSAVTRRRELGSLSRGPAA
ncbi:MAG: DNA-3-methyladenine glycosylase [Planctomycetes bacterium]|nr:DNA-3-methyladenine glycosylase [Planctomycetota bacterium]MCW8134783.1 DNA-3-methyladenine glycosylase [Planctomycetota bacterium]